MNFMFSWQEQVSHSFAALTREILFFPLEHKIHIFSPPCNILYIYYAYIRTWRILNDLKSRDDRMADKRHARVITINIYRALSWSFTN